MTSLAELQVRWSEIQKEFSLKTPRDFPLSWSDKQFLSELRKSKEAIHLRGFGKSFMVKDYPELIAGLGIKQKPKVFHDEAAQFEKHVVCGKGVLYWVEEMKKRGELKKFPPEPIGNRHFKIMVGKAMHEELKKKYPFLFNNL